MKTTLVQWLASTVNARETCRTTNNTEWFERHTESLKELVKNFMPSGSGIDNGTKIDLERSRSERLVFTFGYHHMDESGMYNGWTHHELIVTPSLVHGFSLKITGPNRNDVKEYFYEMFQHDLDVMIDWSEEKERWVACD